MRKPKSKPLDAEGMRKRVDDALLKDARGEPLTEKELMIVQWIKHGGGGCRACSSGIAVRLQSTATGGSRDGHAG